MEDIKNGSNSALQYNFNSTTILTIRAVIKPVQKQKLKEHYNLHEVRIYCRRCTACIEVHSINLHLSVLALLHNPIFPSSSLPSALQQGAEEAV